MAANTKHHATLLETTSKKEHTVDESYLDQAIHLNEAIQKEIDKDEKRVRRIIRKVDFRMIPVLGLLYMWALIDRVNLPNIQIAGMYRLAYGVLHKARCLRFCRDGPRA